MMILESVVNMVKIHACTKYIYTYLNVDAINTTLTLSTLLSALELSCLRPWLDKTALRGLQSFQQAGQRGQWYFLLKGPKVEGGVPGKGR